MDLPTHPLRPAITWRAGFVAVAAIFLVATLRFAGQLLSGSSGWTTTNKILLPVMVVLTVSTVLGAVIMFRYAVWVEGEDLCVRYLTGTKRRSLLTDTTVTFEQKSQANQARRLDWVATVRRQGEQPVRVETPWVADISDLAELLQPFLATNPGLAADDLTRRCLERPDHMARPAGA